MPVDLSLLLDTTGHWNKTTMPDAAAPADDVRTKNDTDGVKDAAAVSDPNESGHEEWKNYQENEKRGASIKDKDKWRESGDQTNRLETLREESFTSGDGCSSGQSMSSSTTMSSCSTATITITSTAATIDHTSTFPNTADIGLPLHSSPTCLGCFTLCQRQEIVQPVELLDAVCADDAATNKAAMPDGLRPPPSSHHHLKESSRPETPVEKWEMMQGRTTEDRVRVRKEVLRYVTNMANPIVTAASESGLLAIKQRWPETFRDVCLYSEVCQLISSSTYSLPARHFMQEMFTDVPFKEVFEEANCLLKKLGICSHSATATPATTPLHNKTRRTSNHVSGGKYDAATRDRVALVKKGIACTNGDAKRKLVGFCELDDHLGDTLFIKEDLPDTESDANDGSDDGGSCVVIIAGNRPQHPNIGGDLDAMRCLVEGDNVRSVESLSSSDTASKDRLLVSAATVSTTTDDCCAIADGGIVLLTRQATADSSAAGGDLTLSDWDGLSSDDEQTCS